MTAASQLTAEQIQALADALVEKYGRAAPDIRPGLGKIMAGIVIDVAMVAEGTIPPAYWGVLS